MVMISSVEDIWQFLHSQLSIPESWMRPSFHALKVLYGSRVAFHLQRCSHAWVRVTAKRSIPERPLCHYERIVKGSWRRADNERCTSSDQRPHTGVWYIMLDGIWVDDIWFCMMSLKMDGNKICSLGDLSLLFIVHVVGNKWLLQVSSARPLTYHWKYWSRFICLYVYISMSSIPLSLNE